MSKVWKNTAGISDEQREAQVIVMYALEAGEIDEEQAKKLLGWANMPNLFREVRQSLQKDVADWCHATLVAKGWED